MAFGMNRFGGVLAGALLGGLTPACGAPETELEPLPSATFSASASAGLSGSTSASARPSGTTSASSALSTSTSASTASPSASLTASASALPTSTAAVDPSASVTIEVPDAAIDDGSVGDAAVGDAWVDVDAGGDAGAIPTVTPTATAIATVTATATATDSSDGGVPTDDAALMGDAADESDAGGDPEADSSVAEPDASVAVWTANVTCDWGVSATMSTQIVQPVLTLTNLDSSALNLSVVEIRYYFSADGHAATLASDIYYSTAPTKTDTIQASPGLGADADHYLSVQFVGCNGAGCSLADGDSAEVQAAIIVNNGGQTFNALNDYSYGGGLADPCDSVVVLKSGTVIFGNPPG